MDTPPAMIDSAKIIAYVLLDPITHPDSGLIRLYRDGEIQTSFHGLAIAVYDTPNSGTYLFFCDSEWRSENDTLHDSIDDAIDTANRKFGIHANEWVYTDTNEEATGHW